MSSGSRSTTLGYSPRIASIRKTSGAETNHEKTVYIRREDGEVELIRSVWEYSAYSMDSGESLMLRERSSDYWEAYNTIAKWIISGNIRLSGGEDCFRRLCSPRAGVGTLEAGTGILFSPDEDLHTYGTIYEGDPGDRLIRAHISEPHYVRRQATNSITLLRRRRYLIAGDDANTMIPDEYPRYVPELMICHRGRLQDAGFEIPGGIGKQDLWLLDSAGKWKGTQPLQWRVTCSSCLQSYADRKWPEPGVCEGEGHCYNAMSGMELRCKSAGCTPALAEVECAGSLVGTYRDGREIYSRRPVRDIKRVLDGNFAVRDWDHLSEMTGIIPSSLAELFCSVPSLGQRLNKKGACFVPWARESGIILGDYLRIRVEEVKRLYVVVGQAVIEIHTGLKIKFEDDNGVTHVERESQDFSERLPVGVSKYVSLGDLRASV